MSNYAEIYRKHSRPLSCEPTGVKPVLNQLTGIKAVIFDIYGTLFISGSGDIGINAAQQKEEALRAVLAEQLALYPPASDSLTEMLTASIVAEHDRAKAAGVIYPEIDIREHWDELLAPYGTFTASQIADIAVYYEVLINPIWPMPHVSETLSAIAESGCKLGIISNAQFYTHDVFAAFFEGEEFPFDPALCLYSYQERRAKPGSHMYQKMVARLKEQNILPHEVLYIGNDMRNDINPANEVGFQTVLQAGDKRSYRARKEDQYPPPNTIITDLKQILEILC